MGAKENSVQAEVLDALKYLGVFAWRNNNQGRWLPSKGTWIKSAAFPGISDILGMTREGRFVGVECKSSEGTATPEQLEFIAEVRRRGGIGFVARCAQDVFDNFKENT